MWESVIRNIYFYEKIILIPDDKNIIKRGLF